MKENDMYELSRLNASEFKIVQFFKMNNNVLKGRQIDISDKLFISDRTFRDSVNTLEEFGIVSSKTIQGKQGMKIYRLKPFEMWRNK